MDKGGPLIIRGLTTLSSIGIAADAPVETWEGAFKLRSAPVESLRPDDPTRVFRLSSNAQRLIQDLEKEGSCHRLDRVALLGISAARLAIERARDLGLDLEDIGCVSFGSSRGATETLESSFRLANSSSPISALTSPVTTAGNISSSIAQDLLNRIATQSALPSIACVNTSMTCSSAFHSLLVARSFILSSMAKAALFGGAEACLTPYTIAQLKALRIYSDDTGDWPCRALGATEIKKNTVALGEAAGAAVLFSRSSNVIVAADDLELSAIGWAMERVPSPTGITEDGAAFEKSMDSAVAALDGDRRIVGVVMHAPGSQRGDEAELVAVRRVLGNIPVYSTKHLTGHSYGAAPMLSLSLASAILSGARWPGFPYQDQPKQTVDPISQGGVILVNSAGFGGNAISVAVSKPL